MKNIDQREAAAYAYLDIAADALKEASRQLSGTKHETGLNNTRLGKYTIQDVRGLVVDMRHFLGVTTGELV